MNIQECTECPECPGCMSVEMFAQETADSKILEYTILIIMALLLLGIYYFM